MIFEVVVDDEREVFGKAGSSYRRFLAGHVKHRYSIHPASFTCDLMISGTLP